MGRRKDRHRRVLSTFWAPAMQELWVLDREAMGRGFSASVEQRLAGLAQP